MVSTSTSTSTSTRATRTAELHRCLPELMHRALYTSVKWAAELLQSLCAAGASDTTAAADAVAADKSEAPDTGVVLAQSYIGRQMYQAAAAALQGRNRSKMAVFLRLYALFMAGEAHKAEELALEAPSSSERSAFTNDNVESIRDELSSLYREGSMDGFLLFLYGIVLKEIGDMTMALSVLVESVSAFPCNWSAWKALASLCTDKNTVMSLELPDHWTRSFFLADVFLALHENMEALSILNTLSQEENFSSSTHVLAQTAMVHYNEREFDLAQELFEELRAIDPMRLENMDTYSNILYVKESRGALSLLAHHAVKINKYCPETCCIIGNYYSLKAQHEKAALYFQRALKLNPNYLSAWTLMGHEFVEMRNTNAAIQAYRKAVEINPRDYRAWYGLGQTYEILQMHTYSMYYFRKATHLRPYDPRMWCAMAECYERLGRLDDAINCFKRAESNQDREGIALTKLAKLYHSIGDTQSAFTYYSKVLERDDTDETASMETVDALLFLAQFYKENRRWDEAEQCCTRLLDIGGSSRDTAKSLLKEIQQLRLMHPGRGALEDDSMHMSP